jgi:hypothetical protein
MLVQQANMRVRSATIDDLHRISPGNGPIILSIGNRPISSTNLGDFHYHDSQKVSTLTPEKGFIDPRKTNRFVLSNQGLELHHRCDMHVNRGWISRKKTTTVWWFQTNKPAKTYQLNESDHDKPII